MSGDLPGGRAARGAAPRSQVIEIGHQPELARDSACHAVVGELAATCAAEGSRSEGSGLVGGRHGGAAPRSQPRKSCQLEKLGRDGALDRVASELSAARARGGQAVRVGGPVRLGGTPRPVTALPFPADEE